MNKFCPRGGKQAVHTFQRFFQDFGRVALLARTAINRVKIHV